METLPPRYYLPVPWTLDQARPADAETASDCLTTIFGWKKNDLKTLSLSAPRDVRLADHATMVTVGARIEVMLTRRFDSHRRELHALPTSMEKLRREPSLSAPITASYAVPSEIAASIHTSLIAPQLVLDECDWRGRRGPEVDALRLLVTLLPRLIVLGKVAGFSTGTRKWLVACL